MIKQTIALTHFSGDVFLVDDAPTWGQGVTVDAEFSIPGDLQSSLTHRETRRAYGASLRTNLKYQAFPHGAAIPRLQLALRQWTTEPIVIPFWPAVQNWSNRASSQIQGGLFVVWKADRSQYEIYDTVEPGWPVASDWWAPAVMGFIVPTQPDIVEPDKARWNVQFTESSEVVYALTVSGSTFTAGPQPAGYATAPKVLPISPNYTRQSESLSVNVIRKNAGFTRNVTATVYPQGVTRTNQAEYTLKTSGISAVIQFFAQYAGLGASFWSPGFMQLSALTTITGAGDTVIHVANTTAILANDYVAFFDGGRLMALKRVASVNTGASTITLTTAIGAIVSVLNGVILPLSLVRLDKSSVSLQWSEGSLAKTELKLVEVPAEYVPPGDETLGVTIGQLKKRVSFLTFTRDFGYGSSSTQRYTNYEADLTYSGHTYTSSNWGIGDIPHSIDLESDAVQVKTFTDDIGGSQNPLVADLLNLSEAPLNLKIEYADYDGTNFTNVETVFNGTLAKVSKRGKEIDPTFNAGPAIMENQLPHMVRGTMCNHVTGGIGTNADDFLISVGCGQANGGVALTRTNFKCTAKVKAPVSSAFPYTLNLDTFAAAGAAPLPTTADYFAFGWVEWKTGTDIQRRAIIGSTAPVAGVLALTLHRWFQGNPSVGDNIALYPGCDGMRSTCINKFLNDKNFGGEPFSPIGNPSLTKLADNPAAGAKK